MIQHGTAIVVLAGIINALKVTGKAKEACQVVVNGAGSAGVAITKLLLTYGFRNVIMCDKSGILSEDSEGLNWMQREMGSRLPTFPIAMDFSPMHSRERYFCRCIRT